MNNRGGVLGFGLLPLFALAAIAVVLVNFVSYDNNVKTPMTDVTNSIKMVDFNEAYIISTAKIIAVEAAQNGLTKESFMAAAAKHYVHIDGQGNFFVLVNAGQFKLENNALSIPNLFVLGQTNTATIRRNMDLEMQFDAKGEFIRFINK
jgi:hypothetical protein